MHPPDYFRPTMDRLDGILGRLGVRYHLTGGLASIAYGDPRTTQDLDVVIDASAMARSFEQFLAAAGPPARRSRATWTTWSTAAPRPR